MQEATTHQRLLLQSGGFPYGCLSPMTRFSEGFRTPARLKVVSENAIPPTVSYRTVRMVAEEISVVSVADEVAIEIPLPGCALSRRFPANGGVVK